MSIILTPAELVSAVRSTVAGKKGTRAIVESLREVSLLSYPAAPLFPSLLSILQTLKCQKKSGEENKAVRHCYQYISWLAASGLLDEGGALTVMHQLARIDLRDDLLPRRLAALQLFAELSVIFPGAAATCGPFGFELGPLLVTAGTAVLVSLSSSKGPSRVTSTKASSTSLGLFMAPGAYGALATITGSLSQPHAALRARLPSGLASSHPDVCHASALALFRAIARACTPTAVAQDAAGYRHRRKRRRQAALSAAAAGGGGKKGAPPPPPVLEASQDGGAGPESKGKRSKESEVDSEEDDTVDNDAPEDDDPEDLQGAPITLAQLCGIVEGASPGEWTTAVGPYPLSPTAAPDVAALFLRATATCAGIDTTAHWREDPVVAPLAGECGGGGGGGGRDDKCPPTLNVARMAMGGLRLGTSGDTRRLAEFTPGGGRRVEECMSPLPFQLYLPQRAAAAAAAASAGAASAAAAAGAAPPSSLDGPSSEAMYHILLGALSDPRPSVSFEAMKLLAGGGIPRLGQAVPAVFGILRSWLIRGAGGGEDGQQSHSFPHHHHHHHHHQQQQQSQQPQQYAQQQPPQQPIGLQHALCASALRTAVALGVSMSVFEAHLIRRLRASLQDPTHTPPHTPTMLDLWGMLSRVSIELVDGILGVWVAIEKQERGVMQRAQRQAQAQAQAARAGQGQAQAQTQAQAQEQQFSGSGGGVDSAPTKHLRHLVLKALAWCTPSLALASAYGGVSSNAPLPSYAMFPDASSSSNSSGGGGGGEREGMGRSLPSNLLLRLAGLSSSISSSATASSSSSSSSGSGTSSGPSTPSLISGEVSEGILSHFFTHPWDAHRAIGTGVCALGILHDAPATLDSQHLWSLWEALGDRAVCMRQGGGGAPVPVAFGSIVGGWVLRGCGWAMGGVGDRALPLLSLWGPGGGASGRPTTSTTTTLSNSPPPTPSGGGGVFFLSRTTNGTAIASVIQARNVVVRGSGARRGGSPPPSTPTLTPTLTLLLRGRHSRGGVCLIRKSPPLSSFPHPSLLTFTWHTLGVLHGKGPTLPLPLSLSLSLLSSSHLHPPPTVSLAGSLATGSEAYLYQVSRGAGPPPTPYDTLRKRLRHHRTPSGQGGRYTTPCITASPSARPLVHLPPPGPGILVGPYEYALPLKSPTSAARGVYTPVDALSERVVRGACWRLSRNLFSHPHLAATGSGGGGGGGVGTTLISPSSSSSSSTSSSSSFSSVSLKDGTAEGKEGKEQASHHKRGNLPPLLPPLAFPPETPARILPPPPQLMMSPVRRGGRVQATSPGVNGTGDCRVRVGREGNALVRGLLFAL